MISLVETTVAVKFVGAAGVDDEAANVFGVATPNSVSAVSIANVLAINAINLLLLFTLTPVWICRL